MSTNHLETKHPANMTDVELRETLDWLIENEEYNLAGLSHFKKVITDDELLLLYFEQQRIPMSFWDLIRERNVLRFVL